MGTRDDPQLDGRLAASLGVASTVLAACGGSEGAPPAAFFELSQARPDQGILAAASGREAAQASSTAPLPTVDELLDWAELAYPTLFPGRPPSQQLAPYTYRYYGSTRNHLGVAGSDIYLLGPVSGDVLLRVGTLADFAERVAARRFAFSDAQAARFLHQATLGATDADIAAVRSLGFEAWLEQQFARPRSPGAWDYLVSKAVDQNADARNGTQGFDAMLWQQLLSSPESLRQRVALALSEIFVVGIDGITGPWRQFQMAAWWDMLLDQAFGNFRSLLEAVTLSAAMGRYLNMAGNQKEDPNTGRLPDENYAREVMQLFTIGLTNLEPDGGARLDAQGRPVDSYSQDTVTNLARVLTGWNVDLPRGDLTPAYARRPMVLNATLHSTLAASFLGTTVPANTDGRTALRQALDTLAGHPNVGPFIGRQLIQRLVTSNPSPAYVARVSAAFADNGRGQRGDMKAVLRAVLLDEEARSAAFLTEPHHGKLREPMLRFVQWARAFKASSASGDWTVGNTSDPGASLGQSPLRSASVFNFFRPGYVPPNTAIGAAGLMAPELQITNESSVAGYLNTMQVISTGARDIKPEHSAELALVDNPASLLARVELLLAASQLSAASRDTIVQALTAMPVATPAQRNNRVYTAVFLVLAAPEFLVQK